MKAKSRILKKSEKELMDHVVDYFNYWTKKELRSLQGQENSPVLLQLGENFIVGKYTIKKSGYVWEIYDRNSELVTVLYHKLPAIFYCLASTKNKINLATQIESADRLVNKYQVDKEQFAISYKNSVKNKDQFKQILCLNRLSNNEIYLRNATNELQKNMSYAKYLNLGKTNYETH